LAGREAALWLATESLTLEHEGVPLSCYEVRVEAETGELRSVGRPRLFGTSAVVAQPKLFGLDALGEAGWLKALRLEGYAPRWPRGGWRCRRRSSPTRRTSSVPEAEGLRAPGGHGELLGRAVARLQQDERVVALILGGSLARGSADLYSDVDLYGVVRDGAFDAVLAERDAVTEVVGSRLFAFDVDPVSGGSTDRIVLYGGPDGEPIKFDFMYLK